MKTILKAWNEHPLAIAWTVIGLELGTTFLPLALGWFAERREKMIRAETAKQILKCHATLDEIAEDLAEGRFN